jgi:hypothetical protein
MFESGEYFYSIAALFSLSAYVLSNILWLRIFLVLAAIVYIISGVNLGITSMVGWNSAYLVINLFHVGLLLLDKSTITLPEETKEIYHQFFSAMSTREFKKLITINQFQTVKGERLIAEGEVTDRLFMLLEGKVNIVKSEQKIASLNSGDLVGEMSFMSKDPASADVIAAEVVKYAYWTHEDLEKLCQKNCIVYNKFISIIGCDLVRKLNAKNAELMDKG